MSYTNGLDKPSDYFNTVLYTGTSATHNVTGVGFQPDLTWFKRRDSSAQHSLFDSVRGVTKQLASNLTNADTTITDALTSFDSDGFTLGVDSGNYINFNSATYASWSWLASNTTTSNTDGSITSTVSANTTSGFSIVSYTGTGSSMSVGHGLSQKPDIVIFKNRDAVVNWGVYTDLIDGSYDYLYLNATNAKGDSGSYSANSTTFSFSASSTVANTSGEKVISYCFHSVKGFSKMGTYTGNGSTDGAFVYTGFKPAFIIAKESSEARDWQLWDNKRLGYNATGGNKNLLPNSSNAEDTYADIDILSNGFKLRSTSSAHNKVSQTYIYMAFAENPFVTSTGIPTTAR